MSTMKYYLIHNLDVERKQTMITEFNKWGFDLNNINWIEHPNKNEITDELLDSLIIQEPSYSSGVFYQRQELKPLKD